MVILEVMARVCESPMTRQTPRLLRKLRATNATMRTSEYARQVGIVKPGEQWHIKHLRPTSEVLGATAVVARQSGEELDFHRLVNAATGKPGSGARGHQSRIIRRCACRSLR